MKRILLLILLLPLATFGQKKFQKIFKQTSNGSSYETFDAKQTWDGGYILTGLVSDSSSSLFHPFILRLDCQEKIVWQKDFGFTSTINNIFPKVIITKDSQFVCINNLGSFTNYQGFVAKVDDNGTVVWQKTVRFKTGSNNLNHIEQTTDGGYILTGGAGSTPDVALAKLDANGTMLWQQTYGGVGNIDEGACVIQTLDGGFAVTGRYISMLTFNAFLLKTDAVGNLQFLKCYGDTNQHMRGFDIKQLSNNDYVIIGSTTLLKPSFQSSADNFIMRLNSQGDTLWTKIFYGNPDLFENPSTFYVDKDNNFVVAVATASYPSTAIVLNKHALAKFSPTGNLLKLVTYNDGYSHYPSVVKANDGGALLCGFSTKYTGAVGFNTLLIKTDADLKTSCGDNDVTSLTTVTSTPFKITLPTPVISNTIGTVNTNASNSVHNVVDTLICETKDSLIANFGTTGTCVNTNTLFSADTSSGTYFLWDFGDGNSTMDTATTSNASYTYPIAGTYNVQLTVSNGCISKTITKPVVVTSNSVSFNLGLDTNICVGQSIQLSANNNAQNYLWNTGDTSASITVQTAGTYILTTSTGFCPPHTDTIVVDTINCNTNKDTCAIFAPNAFSPNFDNINDKFFARIPSNSKIEFINMNIYNRYGEVIYTTTDIGKGWDGTRVNTMLTTDNFYYIIRYKCSGKTLLLKGDLILVR